MRQYLAITWWYLGGKTVPNAQPFEAEDDESAKKIGQSLVIAQPGGTIVIYREVGEVETMS